ncbi:MAG TPA: ABC transporter permease [Firmicutes bacterium]|nr:ABC transporter permease [Bacillota bacterium]
MSGNEKKITSIWAKVLIYIVLSLGAIIMLFPFVFMILTSFKTLSESMSIPPKLFPEVFQFENYSEALKMAPFDIYFVNTLISSVANTVLTVFVTIFAAFAFTRYNFFGSKILFTLLLATMMVPGEMLIIQNVVTVTKLGWIDTFRGLVIPYIANVFYIFLLRQYFMQIPEQLYKAAKIDGCSDFKYLWKILIPNTKNALVTIAILNFIASWNAFLWPLLITNKKEMRVLTIGLTQFTTEAGSQVHLQMAAATIIVVPVVIVYLFLQKYIISGVTRGGLKG